MHSEEPTPALPTQPPQRVLAISTHGDRTWKLVQPVLDYLIQNGDEEMRTQALQARAYWEKNQQWLIDWCNQTRFFQFAEAATQNPRQFKRALETLPPETEVTIDIEIDGQEQPKRVDLVAYLALQAGEKMHAQARIRGKRRGKKNR